MKDWLFKVIRDTKSYDHLRISESRDSETDTNMTSLVTYGYSADHRHFELSIEECKVIVEFLNELIKKSGA